MSGISFEGQRAIVTGAGVAIGRAHAHDLARRGAAVLVNDADVASADRVVEEIRAAGGKAVANHDPVGSKEAGEAIVAHAVREFGGIEIVINNAGVRGHNLFENMTEQQIKAVMDVHLMASIYVTQPAWKIMRAQKYGRIVMTSSSSGMFSHQGLANYAAAKAGVYGLTKALAYEGGPYDIKVNALLPYSPDVGNRKPPIPNMAEEWAKFQTPEETAKLKTTVSTPDMISHMAVYLASRECEVSGELFSVCNGRYARVFVGIADGWLSRPDEAVSAEAVRDHLSEIRDISRHSVPMWLFEEVAAVARRI